jgi:hypothetical protein
MSTQSLNESNLKMKHESRASHIKIHEKSSIHNVVNGIKTLLLQTLTPRISSLWYPCFHKETSPRVHPPTQCYQDSDAAAAETVTKHYNTMVSMLPFTK